MRGLGFYIFVSAIFILSCREDCPDKYTFTKDRLPDCERSHVKYWDVTQLVFVSEEYDTLVFDRYRLDEDMITLDLIEHSPCAFDDTKIVEIYYERLWNRMFYASENGDSIAFQYFPQKPSLEDFSFELYDKIEAKELLYLPRFYRSTMVKFQDTQFSLFRLLPSKYGDCEINPSLLEEDIFTAGQSIENLYSSDVLSPVIIYYSFDHDLVGLKDVHGKNWIRLI